MKILIQKILILVFFIDMFSSIYGNETSKRHSEVWSESDFLCLKQYLNDYKIIDNKVYIESDKILIVGKQIYLNLVGVWLPIQKLSVDESGLFVTLEEVLTNAKSFWGNTWTCPNPNCGYENYDSINYCALCGTKKP